MNAGNVHRLLVDFFKFPIYITTNYDKLIETTNNDFGIIPRVIASDFQLQVYEQEPGTVKIIKMHGDFENPEALVVTKLDYDNYFTKNETIALFVQNLFRTKSILLIGYSGIDPDYQQILQYRARFGDFSRRIYILIMDNNVTEDIVISKENNIFEIRVSIKDRSHEEAIIYFFRCLFNAVQRYKSNIPVYGESTISEQNKLPILSIYVPNQEATKEEIASLELHFNSQIPNSLKIFLRYGNGGKFVFKYKDGDVYEDEFFTINEMKSTWYMPRYLLPFCGVGNGDYWCLNLHNFKKWDECTVAYWSHFSEEVKVTNKYLYDWLLNPSSGYFKDAAFIKED